MENFNGNEAELNTISSTLANVAADVKELLNNNNAVVNSSIIITNPAQLLLAESLVDTRTDASNVIINGEVRVEFTNNNLTAAQKTRAQAVLNKIATVVEDHVELTNTASPTSAIALPNLNFIDGNLEINGAAASLPSLLNVSDDLTINHGGAIGYPVLANVGGDVILNTSVLGNITSLDLGGIEVKGNLIANGTNEVSLPKATKADFGTSKVVTATLAIATDVDLGYAGTLASLKVDAAKATSVDIAAKTISGNIVITNIDKDGVITIPNLTQVNAIEINTSGAANLNKVKTVATVALINSKAVSIPELTTSSGTLTFGEATTLNFPKLTLTNPLIGSKAETLSFKSGTDALLTTKNKAKSITVLGLGNTTDFDASTQTILESLSITGAANSKPSAGNVTSRITATGSKLKNVTLNGLLDWVTIQGAEVIGVTTAGNIRYFKINDADKLTTASIGHDHISGSGAAELYITNNAKLTGINLASVSDVGTLEIKDNDLLTSFTAPNKEVRVEKNAAVRATVTGNKLSGVYTRAIAAIPGTSTTAPIPAVASTISQASVYGLRQWLEAHFTNTASPTWEIDIEAFDDNSDTDTKADNGNYDAVTTADGNNSTNTSRDKINTYIELKTVKN